MKAIDIAKKNHIMMNDMLEVCKELGIKCENEESELSDQELFLIEKKVEVLKAKLIERAEKSKKSKKIKLKRKVHVSNEMKKKKGTGTAHRKDDAKTGKNEKPAKEDTRKKFDNKTDMGKKTSPQNKPYQKRTDNKNFVRKPVTKKPESKDDISIHKKTDTSKSRKKGKEKEKESKKKYTKSKITEKAFSIKKKTHVEEKQEAVSPSEISMTEGITVGELAKKLNVKANEIITKLMKLGEMATINQSLDVDTAVIVASEYNSTVNVVSLYDETVIKHDEVDNKEDYIDGIPVVTVMGHVDHGKTKLLDAIRKTNVVDQEHGGITQHIGAYTVNVGNKQITFLDTPGHSAFSAMRARGASVTNIVILVVAANDGVMPQTIEAIDHAKDAGVPIIVAINKIDLEDANPQKVKQELSNYGIIPEEWGGSSLFIEISAKQEIKIEELLELILIQTEMLELKVNPKCRAMGTVLEAKLDVGKGSIATVLVQKGTLKVGHPFVVGIFSGKVRAMNNDQGKSIKEAGPSIPVEVYGITGVPEAGNPFECVETEKYAKQISQKRLEYKRIESAKKVNKVTLESLNSMIKEGEIQDLRIIVKADVDGSAKALKESLEELSSEDVRVKVIHTGIGGINESDVMLASASNAIIIGYHVRPTGRVGEIADRENVSIKFYNIIFEATDDIKAAMKGMLKPIIREEIVGTGEILQAFKITKIGTIGGSILHNGKINRKCKVRLIRDGVVIYDSTIGSLKRFKDDVSEVNAGQEFGFHLDNFNDIKEGDNFEFYIEKEIPREIED